MRQAKARLATICYIYSTLCIKRCGTLRSGRRKPPWGMIAAGAFCACGSRSSQGFDQAAMPGAVAVECGQHSRQVCGTCQPPRWHEPTCPEIPGVHVSQQPVQQTPRPDVSGDVSADGFLAGLAATLRRHPMVAARGSVTAEAVEAADRIDLSWAQRLALLREYVLSQVPVLVVLDNFDDNLSAESGSRRSSRRDDLCQRSDHRPMKLDTGRRQTSWVTHRSKSQPSNSTTAALKTPQPTKSQRLGLLHVPGGYDPCSALRRPTAARARTPVDLSGHLPC